MGEQPQLTGFLGWPAVWVLVCQSPDMAAFLADVWSLESREDSGGDRALVQQMLNS